MKTYKEDGKYYAVVETKNGPYFIGPFNSRSTARRRAINAKRN
jgi:hypothetical protein